MVGFEERGEVTANREFNYFSTVYLKKKVEE
jgi:hypothetical protein